MDNNSATSKASPKFPEGSMERKQEEQHPSTSSETSARPRFYREGQDEDGAPAPPEGCAHHDYEEASHTKRDLEQSEQTAMAAEEHKNLHEAIAEGSLELVRGLLRNNSAEKYFSYEGKSALHEAFYNRRYDIASYLIHIGAKIDDSEIYDVYELEVDLDQVNSLLLEYNRKSGKSCIFQLTSWSQSPQGLDGEHLKQVMSMYEDFFESKILKLLMKVIEYTSLEIVYDLESEDVNRIFRYNVKESEIYGLTSSREIFVGARTLLLGDPQKRSKVYGVVAEELCHLALDILFENDAKPHRKEDLLSKKDFQKIVSGVESLVDRSCPMESVIADVFMNYDPEEWECELIARVPHVVGIYGEEVGKKKFMAYTELSSLLCFYQQHVIPKCEQYIEDSRNMKHHQLMEDLRKKEDFMTYKEKTMQPVKEGFRSFKEHVVDENGISVITTNCTRLCMLHVYHELKRDYGDALERKCLFFSRKCFDNKRHEILDALNAKVWEYFILVLDKRELSLERLKAEYLDHFDSFKTAGIKVIVISGFQDFGEKFESKALNYKWNDLSSEYQEFRTCRIEYIFKGERKVTYIKTEDVPIVFQNESEILQLMSGETFVVGDGTDLESPGFILETYLDREFQVKAVNKTFIQNPPLNTNIFVYGLNMSELKELSVNEKLVQWVKGSDDEIQKGKSVFIFEDERAIKFGDFVRKTRGDKHICLHQTKQGLILRNAESLGKDFKEDMKKVKIKEENMIHLVIRNKILIISDNAGSGKSTVTSNLVRRVQKYMYNSWVFRIDLRKFSMHGEDCSSECSNNEDIFDEIFSMIGLKNGFERWHFKKFSNQVNCFIFFDGYDEVSPKYQTEALELISFLRRNTEVKIIITTRKHYQQELEEKLNSYSHQLVSFSDGEKVSCLVKLWKWKLKYPYGEERSEKVKKAILRKMKIIIRGLERDQSKLEYQNLLVQLAKIVTSSERGKCVEGLDSVRLQINNLCFSRLAENILKKTIVERNILEFMGIPLHLYMVGSIYYNGNFDVQIGSDIYSLYCEFIKQKILIYVEEKEGLVKEGIAKDMMMKCVREEAFKTLIQLADNLFDEGRYTEVEGRLNLCLSLGLVVIHGGETLFLHQSFAEFFKAESVRQNIEKEIFVKMLTDDRCEVGRRFLSSALEKKTFENVTKELFEDLDFLNDVVRWIVNFNLRYGIFAFNSDFICSLSIVKKLLEGFEATVEPKCFNEFIEVLNGVLKVERSEGLKLGGCLTAVMMKKLIVSDLEVNSILFFGLVRFAQSYQDIIDVLMQYIVTRSDNREIGSRRDEKSDTEYLLELLKLKDSKGIGLFSYALFNEIGGMFPHLMVFYRDFLGRERFLREIIGSHEYKQQMKKSIILCLTHVDTFCALFKELRSVFGDEAKMLFDNDLKLSVIYRTVGFDNEREFRNVFDKVISSFIACFGGEDLKDVLLSKDSYGSSLVIRWYPNTTLIKLLNAIDNILGDRMKQLLKSKNKHLQNIFHCGAESKNEINFDFLDTYLSQCEIADLLTERDASEWTCLQNAAFYSLRSLLVLLNYAEKALGSDGSRFEGLILGKNRKGDTFLHLLNGLSCYSHPMGMKGLFNLLREKLSDDLFNRLLRVRNEDGQTFLQINRPSTEKIIECCKEMLKEELFKELLKKESDEESEGGSQE